MRETPNILNPRLSPGSPEATFLENSLLVLQLFKRRGGLMLGLGFRAYTGFKDRGYMGNCQTFDVALWAHGIQKGWVFIYDTSYFASLRLKQ